MKYLLKRFTLNNAWVKSSKLTTNGYTKCDKDNNPKSQIDYVFISDNLSCPLNNIYLRKAPDIDNDRLSDHLGIIIELNTNENTRV